MDLTVSKTHVGNFTQGDTSKSYTITVSNIGADSSSGLVTLSDSLPAGLTARALSGSGWNCDAIPGGGTPGPATLNCTRSDVLAAGNSYPTITLTVDVSCSAAALVTNSATVSGGGDASPGNDTANDPTTVNPDTTPPVITCPGGITKFTDPGQTSATVNPGTPVATDNCGVPTVTGVRSDGKPLNAPYPIGVTLITWTAKDANGNAASCAQSIVVVVPSGQRRIPQASRNPFQTADVRERKSRGCLPSGRFGRDEDIVRASGCAGGSRSAGNHIHTSLDFENSRLFFVRTVC